MLSVNDCCYAQSNLPISISGYSEDVIAEDTLAVTHTSIGMDLQNNIMYSQTFAASAGIAGGIDNSGTIISGTSTYQLANFADSNSIYIPNMGSDSIVFNTPASYSNISICGFSTEGNCTIATTINFTDGSTYVPSNYTYQDWFNGTPSIYCCFGRTMRMSTTYIANGLPSNPRMYAYDIALQCSDKLKKVRSISIQIISGSNVNSRTFIMAVSGVTYSFSSLNFPKNIQCTGPGTGSDSLAVQGSDMPFTYLWNTTNLDTTPQIDSLNAGTYTCTITDVGGCIYKDSVTISETLSPIVIASASNDTITQGDTTLLSVTGLSNYSWSNNISNSTTNVWPDSSAWFIVSGTNNDGCPGIDSIFIFVNPLPPAPPIPPVVIDSVDICQLKIPNVFTPGSDTINNVLEVTCTQTNSIQLSVYNRWGNKIFESSNYQNNWDASAVDAGVYYYLLYYGTLNENRKGFIEVIK